jgi:FKBP-type peptidyl-prolyl cis-trans isomerase FklB
MHLTKIFTICTAVSLSFFCLNSYAEPTSNAAGTAVNAADQNKLVGQAFLAKNMTQPGVVTLPDGLQYKIIKPGTGARPSTDATVTVNYAGRLVNGKEFDSSYQRGEPTSFPLSGVIPGWTEALQRMNKGAIWEIYIPAALAYGEKGAPPVIGPNETLIFKVELIDFK